MRITAWLGLSLLVLGLTGCAGSSEEEPTVAELPTEAPEIVSAPREGSGQFEGQVDDQPVVIADARLFVGPLDARDPTKRGMRIVLADHAGVCQRPEVARPHERALLLDLETGDGPPGAGTYPVGSAGDVPGVTAQLQSTSATCSSKTFLALAGAVTIEEADRTHVRGTFELKLGRDNVRGTFDAVPCEVAPPPPLAMRCDR